MKTVFILAAGDGTRWNNYRGAPKHRLVIEEEVLIERTSGQKVRIFWFLQMYILQMKPLRQ
jgi:2-C-methyl-D-erythritol 4-phosphate cytidylyltransferase